MRGEAAHAWDNRILGGTVRAVWAVQKAALRMAAKTNNEKQKQIPFGDANQNEATAGTDNGKNNGGLAVARYPTLPHGEAVGEDGAPGPFGWTRG
jgi:hypothetical protein